MLAPVTSISTKDNVKNLPTIPGKERNAWVEQISSDHPWRSNQACTERPEKNASRYPDDQRGDHNQKPDQNLQRCESPGSPDAGSEPFLTRHAHAQERQNDTPDHDYQKRDVEKPLYTLCVSAHTHQLLASDPNPAAAATVALTILVVEPQLRIAATRCKLC
jgi:hypothetical protein